MKFAPEVEKALNNKKPIVALESTIISHGLPRPTNLEALAASPRSADGIGCGHEAASVAGEEPARPGAAGGRGGSAAGGRAEPGRRDRGA